MPRRGFIALALILLAGRANAAATMESIEAEKCGGRVNAFEVGFLAPDNAAVEATAKALVNGSPSLAPDAVTLSIDGRPCRAVGAILQVCYSAESRGSKPRCTARLRRAGSARL
jgi:hypothetical protein